MGSNTHFKTITKSMRFFHTLAHSLFLFHSPTTPYLPSFFKENHFLNTTFIFSDGEGHFCVSLTRIELRFFKRSFPSALGT